MNSKFQPSFSRKLFSKGLVQNTKCIVVKIVFVLCNYQVNQKKIPPLRLLLILQQCMGIFVRNFTRLLSDQIYTLSLSFIEIFLELCSFVNSRNISIKLSDKVYIWSLNNRVKFRTKIPMHCCNINKSRRGGIFIWYRLIIHIIQSDTCINVSYFAVSYS